MTSRALVPMLVVAACLAGALPLRALETPRWNRDAAARYLDARMDVWWVNANPLRTDGGEIRCLSCHTALPYMWARHALRRSLGVAQPTPHEQRVVEQVSRRIGYRGDDQPYYDHTEAKKIDSRGVEAVVNAVALTGLEKHPTTRGVLVEQPEVLPDADRLPTARGVRDGCEFLGGRFFDPIETCGKVSTMCQVLNDWPDAECYAVLERCRTAMRDTDRVLVIEMLTVPCEPNPGLAMLDMMMLLYFGKARQRTVDEYAEPFQATRFTFTRVVPTPSAFSIVEARPV